MLTYQPQECIRTASYSQELSQSAPRLTAHQQAHSRQYCLQPPAVSSVSCCSIRQPFSEDPLGTGLITAPKPSHSELEPYCLPTDWQILYPPLIVAMYSPRPPSAFRAHSPLPARFCLNFQAPVLLAYLSYLKTRELKRHQLGRHPDSWYITPHRLRWLLFSLILAPTPRMSQFSGFTSI